jgi:tRNA(Ile)-lysidine synthetase-like protein
LADVAEVAQAEAAYWDCQVAALLPRVLKYGKPSRSGRSVTGTAADTWSLDLGALKTAPLALQRHLLHEVGRSLGAAFECKHIYELERLVAEPKPGKAVTLPGGISARSSFRELQFSPTAASPGRQDFSCRLKIPGEVTIAVLGSTIRARVLDASQEAISRYNPALLDRAQLESELIVRNWRAGDRYFPAHTQAPKKVKQLLQTGRIGQPLAPAERQLWPVVESAGQIVWMRGFAVPAAFAHRSGDAVLIEEVETDTSGLNSEQ